jgi:hypothetical protein
MAHHEAALPKCTQVDSSTLQLDLPLHQEEEVGALHSKQATGSHTAAADTFPTRRGSVWGPLMQAGSAGKLQLGWQ